MNDIIPNKDYTEFFEQLKSRVLSSRYKAVRAVNKELILLYHHIGAEILQKQNDQGWGAKVIQNLSKDLSLAFPEMKGFSVANLHNMRRFAELYPDSEILQQAAGELPWYHHVVLMERVKEPETRLFYIQSAAEYGWSRAVMIHQMELGLHKRQGKAVTNFKEKLASPTSDLANQTLKDPYIFDFLSISKEAHEREIEKGLVAHIENFLMELGAGFSFVGRQYHLTVSRKDYYIDLLFYHLKLRCFIAIELKAVEFEPEHAGKMNFYLSAVDDLLKHPSDNPSIGLILCKTKDQVLAEYALRDVTKPIGLAEYHLTEALPENIKTALPTIEELEAELSKDFDETKDVGDAYNEEEQAMGWYYYLQDTITFPFKAKCVFKKGTSPLKLAEIVEVIGMADTDECLHDMFVNIDWEGDELSVPLSQLEGINVDAKTQQVLNDWHYWLAQGYCF